MADAPDSKSGGGNIVWVQVPPPAPNKNPHSYDENRSCADFLFCFIGNLSFFFVSFYPGFYPGENTFRRFHKNDQACSAWSDGIEILRGCALLL